MFFDVGWIFEKMASAAAPSFHATERQLITPGYADFWWMSVPISWERHLTKSVHQETWKKFCQLQRFVMSYKNSEKEKCWIHHNGANCTLPSNHQSHQEISISLYWWSCWGTFVVLFVQLPAGIQFLLQQTQPLRRTLCASNATETQFMVMSARPQLMT